MNKYMRLIEGIVNNIQIAVVVGSLREDSFNRQLANAITKLTPPNINFRSIEMGNLPLYNQDNDGNQAEPVQRLKSDVYHSDEVFYYT